MRSGELEALQNAELRGGLGGAAPCCVDLHEAQRHTRIQ